MQDEFKISLSKARLENARQCLSDAALLAEKFIKATEEYLNKLTP